MLSYNQIKEFSKLFKTNESVVIREYIQTLFLKELYREKFSSKVFFKGTAIRLVFKGNRFSEDLDFTVMSSQTEFELVLKAFFEKLTKLYGFSFKKRETISTGLKYLLTASLDTVDYKIFINLDFSFREKVLKPTKSIVETDYPIILLCL